MVRLILSSILFCLFLTTQAQDARSVYLNKNDATLMQDEVKQFAETLARFNANDYTGNLSQYTKDRNTLKTIIHRFNFNGKALVMKMQGYFMRPVSEGITDRPATKTKYKGQRVELKLTQEEFNRFSDNVKQLKEISDEIEQTSNFWSKTNRAQKSPATLELIAELAAINDKLILDNIIK